MVHFETPRHSDDKEKMIPANLSTEQLKEYVAKLGQELRLRQQSSTEAGTSETNLVEDGDVTPETLQLEGYAMLGCLRSRKISDASANALVRLVRQGHQPVSRSDGEAPSRLWVLASDDRSSDGGAAPANEDRYSTAPLDSYVGEGASGALDAASAANGARDGGGESNEQRLTDDDDVFSNDQKLGSASLHAGLTNPRSYLIPLNGEESKVSGRS